MSTPVHDKSTLSFPDPTPEQQHLLTLLKAGADAATQVDIVRNRLQRVYQNRDRVDEARADAIARATEARGLLTTIIEGLSE